MELLNSAINNVRDILGAGANPPPTPFVFRTDVSILWPKSRASQPLLLMGAIQQGFISQRALDIVEGLYRHRYLSRVQLVEMFFSKVSKDRSRDALKKVEHWGLVGSMRYKRLEKELPLRTYLLDRGGADILKMYHGREMRDWRFEMNLKSYEYILRILAANEVFLRFLRLGRQIAKKDNDEPEDGAFFFEAEPTLMLSDKPHHYLMPTARFVFRRDGKEIPFFIEVLRGSNAFLYLSAKLAKYEEYYKIFPLAAGNRPVTIFLAETDSALLKIDEMMRIFRYENLKPFARYTTDRFLAEHLLAEAFCKVVDRKLDVAPFKILSDAFQG
jgi:hypothetical protein